MKKYKEFVKEITEPTGDLKNACWKGYTAIGMKMKNGRKVPNCVPIKEAKDTREYDYEGDMAMSQLKSIITNAQRLHDMLKPDTNLPEWVQSKITLAEDYVLTASNYMNGEMNEEIEQLQERGANKYKRSTESGAGLTRAGVMKHRRENPGSKLSTAVTTPPSKLEPGSKAAKRRKSFCARMSGMPGRMKDEKGRPTRKAASLRRWNCN